MVPFPALAMLNAQLSGSKLVWGAAAITASMGSRFIVGDITPAQQGVLRSPLVRRVVVFCMIFLPTRDILLSICMTVVFFALMDGLLNEHSRYCLLPECLRSGKGMSSMSSGPALPVAHKMLTMAVQATHPTPSPQRQPPAATATDVDGYGYGILSQLDLDSGDAEWDPTPDTN